MFGCRGTLPINIELRKAGPEEMLRKHLDAIPANEPDDFTRLQKEQQKRLEEAKANILAAQEKKKDQYDRKCACLECYQVDALVLKKDFLRKKRKGGKLDHIVMWAPIRSSRFFQRVHISCNLLPTQRW